MSAILATMCWSAPILAQYEMTASAEEPLVQQIAALDLDDLLDMKVTLASRTPEKWFQSASAMYVISSEDIRRSGITLVPELLRMAPGVQVARMDANKWKIGIRGFTERFSNKLLVLIDGRIVYSPLFSGVYWDVQNLPVDDIERIEIVRGPGAALWGSNAVNGIINIVTRDAADTRGVLVAATAGAEGIRSQLHGRFGFGKEDGDFHLRISGKYEEHDAGLYPADGIPDLGDAYTPGAEAQDGWEQWQVGFRGDWRTSSRDKLTFFGNYNDGKFGQTRVVGMPPTTDSDTVRADGGYGGVVWQRGFSATSDLVLRLYYDHTERQDAGLREIRNTWTADFQHRFGLGSFNEIMWGGEFRSSNDETQKLSQIFFEPAGRALSRTSFFVQDRITLGQAASWALTVGSKFESNTITDFEYQPSARLAWTPSEATTAWGAVSRAVRTPSRANSDLHIELDNPPGMVIPLGNPDLDSERLMAYELGARHEVSRRFFLDATGFYNDYVRLIEGDNNGGSAVLVGAEAAARYEVTTAWNLAAGYSWIQINEKENATSPYEPPRNMFNLRSYLDLPAGLEFDGSLYYVDRCWDTIPSYTRLDLRFGWVPSPGFDLGLAVQNVLDRAHIETRGGTRLATDVPRSFHLTARLRM